VQAFCDASIDHLGGLDCLVNNAGIAGPTLPIEEIDATDWNACLNICLNSQFHFSKACIPTLRQSGDASITNLSSAAGKHGFAYRTPYAAAKWGVIGLTKSLAIELGADKIRVNAILPGLVAGDRQRNVLSAKAQRLGKSFDEVEQDAFSYTSIKDYVTAQDIADQIIYLASPSGRRISGQAIAVDGDTKMLA
jgi:NAD(P)-dependent dehydrogenase (short-subunit alcohol dehydrogenase family)